MRLEYSENLPEKDSINMFSENKGAENLRCLHLHFRICKNMFSHDAAHIKGLCIPYIVLFLEFAWNFLFTVTLVSQRNISKACYSKTSLGFVVNWT